MKTPAVCSAAIGLAALAAFSAAGPAAASTMRIFGEPIQGGMVYGWTVPGASLTVDGRRVRVSKKGLFLIGFGRDAKPVSDLELRLSNGRTQTYRLTVRQRQYRIQRITGVAKRYVTVPRKFWPRIKAERAMVKAARGVDRPDSHFLAGFRWPAVGRISGVYGSQRFFNGKPRRPHFGVDVAAPAGTPIRAPAAGTVTLAHHLYFAGKTVILDHGHGFSTSYLHMSAIHVKVGQKVKAGDRIGAIGATGRVTGAHLHWSANWFEVRLDPRLLVGAMPKAKPKPRGVGQE